MTWLPGDATLPEGNPGRANRLVCDQITEWTGEDYKSMEPVRCSATVTMVPSASYARDKARRAGWQVRKKVGTQYQDLCPQHKIAPRYSGWPRRNR